MARLFERLPDVSGKTVVITGASNGIGLGIAKAFATRGMAVSINHISNKSEADRVVAEIKAKGGKAIAISGDVTKAADIQRIFAETKQAFGRLDMLINNASVYDLLEVTDENFHRHFNMNVLGFLLATQEATKYFGAKGGRVVNLNSVASDLDPANSAYYTVTKISVDSATRMLAKDLKAKKIHVNSVEIIVKSTNEIKFIEESLVEYLSFIISFYVPSSFPSFLDSGTERIVISMKERQ